MKIVDFERIVRTDHSARQYLLRRCGAVAPFKCPQCASDTLYKIENQRRRRCGTCGYTFNPFGGRRLNEAKISPRGWLWIVKLFELENTASVIADETGISYPTVLKAVDIIRSALAPSPHSRNSFHPGRDAKAEPAAGVDHPGIEAAAVAPASEDRIAIRLAVGTDCLVLADRRLDLASVPCCGRPVPLVDAGRQFPRFRVYCSSTGFWPFAKERLQRYHGISPRKLPLYLSEMVFRWTHRGNDFFESALERLCSYVPGSVLAATIHLASPEKRFENEPARVAKDRLG